MTNQNKFYDNIAILAIIGIILFAFYSITLLHGNTEKELKHSLEQQGYSHITIESDFTACGWKSNKNSMGWDWTAEDILGNPASGTACKPYQWYDLEITHNNKGE